MPPRKKPLVLGIVGVADAAEADIRAQLDDLLKANPIDSLVFMLTDPLTETTLAVVDWADESKIDYYVVDDKSNTDREARGFKRGAKEVMDEIPEDAPTRLIAAITTQAPEGTEGRLLVLFDPELSDDPDSNDGHAYSTLETAEAAGVPCFTLNQGLEPLTLGSDDAEPAAADPEPDPEPEPVAAKEEEPKKRTRRTKAQIEADRAAAEQAKAAEAAGNDDDEAQTNVVPIAAGVSVVSAGSAQAALDVIIEAIATRVAEKLVEAAAAGAASAQEAADDEETPRSRRRSG